MFVFICAWSRFLFATKESTCKDCVVTPCVLIDCYQRFWGTCDLHLQSRKAFFHPEDRGSRFLRNFDTHIQDYTTWHPRRQSPLHESLSAHICRAMYRYICVTKVIILKKLWLQCCSHFKYVTIFSLLERKWCQLGANKGRLLFFIVASS